MRGSPLGAVFDCDGTLVDSAHCWERAYALVASGRGRTLADVRLDELLGASVARAATQLTRDLGAPVDEAELRAALDAAFAADPPQPLPGAVELVAELAERMPLGVASNGPREIVVAVLEQLGVRERFAVVVSAEETPRDKPAPDVYLEACRQLGIAPGDAVAFEDSALGARSARAAGLAVVLAPSAPGVEADADLTIPGLEAPALRTFLGVDPLAAPLAS